MGQEFGTVGGDSAKSPDVATYRLCIPKILASSKQGKGQGSMIPLCAKPRLTGIDPRRCLLAGRSRETGQSVPPLLPVSEVLQLDRGLPSSEWLLLSGRMCDLTR